MSDMTKHENAVCSNQGGVKVRRCCKGSVHTGVWSFLFDYIGHRQRREQRNTRQENRVAVYRLLNAKIRDLLNTHSYCEHVLRRRRWACKKNFFCAGFILPELTAQFCRNWGLLAKSDRCMQRAGPSHNHLGFFSNIPQDILAIIVWVFVKHPAGHIRNNYSSRRSYRAERCQDCLKVLEYLQAWEFAKFVKFVRIVTFENWNNSDT